MKKFTSGAKNPIPSTRRTAHFAASDSVLISLTETQAYDASLIVLARVAIGIVADQHARGILDTEAAVAGRAPGHGREHVRDLGAGLCDPPFLNDFRHGSNNRNLGSRLLVARVT